MECVGDLMVEGKSPECTDQGVNREGRKKLRKVEDRHPQPEATRRGMKTLIRGERGRKKRKGPEKNAKETKVGW